MTPKQICNFVVDAMRCMSCGEIFDSVNHPHEDEDCPKGRASWDGIADRQDLADALYKRLTEHERDE